MELHRVVGLVFVVSSFLVLVWNALTPSNPDHVLNMIEVSGACAFFTLAYFAPDRFAQATQILVLAVAAFIPMSIPTSEFWGLFIAFMALNLLFAYGGFETRPWWKYFATNAVLYALCAIALSKFGEMTPEMYFRAGFWTGMLNMGLWIEWGAVQYYLRQYVKQNRTLLEINKDLHKKMKAGGCEDGA